jgi:hypothetical protein
VRSKGPTGRDLFSREGVLQLRRIAAAASRGSRAAAWAIETFDGDEELATAALVDEARIASARRSLEYVGSSPASVMWVPRWEGEVARLERLFALRKREAPSEEEIAKWIHERLGLEPETERDHVEACDVRRRGAYVAMARPREHHDPVRLLDMIALAGDVFPIGDDWEPVDRAAIEPDLAYTLGHDLAYDSVVLPGSQAAECAGRFLDAFGEGARIFTSAEIRMGRGGGRTPLTLATFDRGVAVLGRERIGIVVVTGED